MKTGNNTFFAFFILCFHGVSCSKIHNFGGLENIGVNFGRFGSNLPPLEKVVELVTSLSIKHVKTFDMDPSVTQAFAQTGVSLSLCVPNNQIPSLASDPSVSESIVESFILPFHDKTEIISISIGNEVSNLDEFSQTLVPAMENFYTALRKFDLHEKILVSTTHSIAILEIWSPPSSATFKGSIAEPVLRPLLSFLNRTGSPFMVNMYPYLTRKKFPKIPLRFALFQGNSKNLKYKDPKTNLVYTNLFDLIVDAFNTAAFSLGFRSLPLVVTETGWPSQGSDNDTDASFPNAAIFIERLIKRVIERPVKGTPLRPGVPMTTYVFSLFDEDQKIGTPEEKHWGLLFPNGTRKYELSSLNLRKSSIKKK